MAREICISEAKRTPWRRVNALLTSAEKYDGRGLLRVLMGLLEQSLMITPMQEFLSLSEVAPSTLTLTKPGGE